MLGLAFASVLTSAKLFSLKGMMAVNEVNIFTKDEISKSHFGNLLLSTTIFNQGIVCAVNTIQIANINSE